MQKRENRIWLCLAHMSGNEMKFVKEAFDTNWVVPLGPNVNGFEDDLKRFVDSVKPNTQGPARCPFADNCEDTPAADCPLQSTTTQPKPHEIVALSSGTAAVHLSLIACGVKPGDEVIVQDFTFCASSHPVTYLGATPVFVDSERDSWNMDPEILEEAIRDRIAKTGKKPKAIVPVALYGMPYQIDRILEVANRYGIPVIEDAAEGMGSRWCGRVLGTFGVYGILSFNGNKMITTSGGGALICPDKAAKNEIMWYATQARDAYPYYQHSSIGYNYRLSNVCAGIGRGQMTVLDEHIAHHQKLAALYDELLKDVKGVTFHRNPDDRYDSNYWLNTITLDPSLKVVGEELAYKQVITKAIGGAAGVIHAVDTPTTDCQPNNNVEAMRMGLDALNIEARPLWKPMHKQPIYQHNPAYVSGVAEFLFRVGLCLPSGPYVTEDDVRYIVDAIKSLIITD